MDFTTVINDYTLEYFDEEHLYLVDGLPVPSITSILRHKFNKRYDGISKAVLKRAASLGTEVHEAIERYCTTGEESDLKEVRNFKFLQKNYKFEVLENEKPVILFFEDEPIAAGRLDMVIKMNGQIGGVDIKRVATLDKNYVAYQLNLYRIAYRQSYGIEWEFLRAIHLKDDTRRFIDIPIDENLTWKFVNDYLGGNNE